MAENNPFMNIVAGIKTGQDFAVQTSELELKKEQIESQRAETAQQRQAVQFQKLDKVLGGVEKIATETRPGVKKALLAKFDSDAKILGIPVDPVMRAAMMDESYGQKFSEFTQNFYTLSPEAKLKLAPQVFEAFGTDKGLEQLNQASKDFQELKVQAEKYNAEKGLKKQEADIKKTETATKAGDDLRSEFNHQKPVQSFDTVLTAYRKIADPENMTRPSAISDTGLIFNIMKMFDPTSTVREGEQAQAENSRGVPDTVRNMYNRVLSGQKLEPKQRNSFFETAKRQLKAEKTAFDGFQKNYSELARRRGVDEEDIKLSFTRDLGDLEKAEKQAAQQGAKRSFSPEQKRAVQALVAKGYSLNEINTRTKGQLNITKDEAKELGIKE